MNNSGIPYNINKTTKDLQNLAHDLMSNSGDFINELIRIQEMDSRIPDEERLSPDPYGCERVFVDWFVNDDMNDDFPLIANDFYKHELANLEEYEDIEYIDYYSGDDWPEGLFNKYTVNQMVNAVNGGSEYTKNLLLNVYKTYYKK